MFDPAMRPLIGPPLERAGAWLAARRVSANAVTLTGLAISLLVLPCLAYQQYEAALVVILANRLCDGLDGAIARRAGPTAFGGYLDIVCDAVFYAAVPLGFALADPRNGVWAALLLGTFVCTMTSFLGRAIVAAKRGEADDGARGRKSFFYAAGIIEGTETIAAFVLFCLLPSHFPLLAGIFAALCLWTVVARVLECADSERNASD
ncbi:MAG: CDP-alcohol phosphatidyltransferase family protein [Enhydrobacter sp.]|nr:CDP-alcohol phosphatidyltransferase family protein [Enhydrobacter sp.]